MGSYQVSTYILVHREPPYHIRCHQSPVFQDLVKHDLVGDKVASFGCHGMSWVM